MTKETILDGPQDMIELFIDRAVIGNKKTDVVCETVKEAVKRKAFGISVGGLQVKVIACSVYTQEDISVIQFRIK